MTTQLSNLIANLQLDEKTKLLQNVNALKSNEHSGRITIEALVPTDLCTLLSAAAAENPDSIAIIDGSSYLSYRRLESAANQIAHFLNSNGIGLGNTVGVCLSRSSRMIVTMLGIMKAGAAYVPLAPDFPATRVAESADDANFSLLVIQDDSAVELVTCPIIHLDELWIQALSFTDNAPQNDIRPDDPAYIIFTSGSTGRPKGVIISHRNVSEYVRDSSFGKYRNLANFSVAFDSTIIETWATFNFGGTMVCAPQNVLTPEIIRAQVRKHGVDFIPLTTALFHALAETDPACFTGVDFLGFGGEAVRADAFRQVRSACPNVIMVNVYGPAEATSFSTKFAVRPGDDIPDVLPIGRPMDNMRAYVLDEGLRPVPQGVIGELCIAGSGVSLGYLNRPSLTAEKFIPDPYSPGQRVYRSGDLVRMLSDGNIEFVGRADHQVKIRGFRVELGEIESHINAVPDVIDAAVLAVPDSGHLTLVAYAVLADGYSADELKNHLSGSLSNYMVPSVIVPLDSMPLTTNLKVDRKKLESLPWRDYITTGSSYVAPRNNVERQLAETWQLVLGTTDPVGIYDGFFTLGGDSIQSLKVVSTAKKHGLHFTVRQLIENQTIDKLAPLVEHHTGPTISQQATTGPVALSPIQQWYFDLEAPHPNYFNQSIAIEVPSMIPDERWNAILTRLINHHDGLRTSFTHDSNGWYATITPPDLTQLSIKRHFVQEVPDHERSARMQDIAAQAAEEFILDAPPLVQAILFDSGEDTASLLLIANHLIIDVVSWRILLEDLRLLIADEDAELPDKTTSWATWVTQLTHQATSSTTQGELPYWEQQLSPVTELPRDYQDTANINSNASSVSASLSQQQTQQLLRDLPAYFNTDINTGLLSAVATALSNYIGTDTIRIDLEGHGRENIADDIDLSRTIGWFTTISPLRITLEGNSAQQRLLHVKEATAVRPRNGLGFGLIKYGTDHNLLPEHKTEVSFNYLGQFSSSNDESNVSSSLDFSGFENHPDNPRSYLIDIVSKIEDGELITEWIYDSTAFSPDTITALLDGTVKELTDLLDSIHTQRHHGYTPSDFPNSGLTTQHHVDSLIEAISNNPAWTESSDPRPMEDCYTQTGTQQGLWFHSQLHQDAGVYHVQSVYTISNLDPQLFSQAMTLTMLRHPILRTSFLEENADRPALQVVWKRPTPQQSSVDLRDKSKHEQQTYIDNYLEEDRRIGFRPTDAPQWRTHLVRTADNTHQLIFSAHHAILDGWSLSLLISDLTAYYDNLSTGRAIQLPPAPTYSAYIEWLQGKDTARDKQYWTTQLQGVEPTNALFSTATDGADTSASTQLTLLDENTSQQLTQLARKHSLTLNTILQGAWALVLSRYTGNNDVTFGSVTAGRPTELPNVDSTIGLFINTLPLRVNVPDDIPLIEWLQTIQRDNVTMREHEHIPLATILNWANIPSTTPLFDTLLVYENYPSTTIQPSTIIIDESDSIESTHYPLTVAVMEDSGRLECFVSCKTNPENLQVVEDMIGHFRDVCVQLLQRPNLPVGNVSLGRITEKEFTESPRANSSSMADSLLRPNLMENPDSLAVDCPEGSLTYRTLDAYATQLAEELGSEGLSNTRVGLVLSRSAYQYIAVFGTLYAGAAFVPLDPSQPESRLNEIVSDSGLAFLLTDNTHLPKATSLGKPVLNVEAIDYHGLKGSEDFNAQQKDPDDEAYLIYTSGSTGSPKGVIARQTAMSHLLDWVKSTSEFSSPLRVGQLSPFGFDAFILELAIAFGTHGTVVVPERGQTMVADNLTRFINERSIEALFFTPGALSTISPDDCRSLRILGIGGEPYTLDLVHKWNDHVSFFNVYGPTETTAIVTSKRVTPDTSTLTIGKALPRTHLYVLDEGLRQVPAGVTGELCISTVGLALGYANRPAETAASFVGNPFSDLPGSRLYRTGDLVRQHRNGDIEFVGRRDKQVKIRGNRIEIPEVLNAFSRLVEVREAHVASRKRSGETVLVAYLVIHEGYSPSIEKIRRQLNELLPAYMVPTEYLFLDSLPLNNNGKTDDDALMRLDSDVLRSEVQTPPTTNTEMLVFNVWKEQLGNEGFGIDDNFFDVGGHSLLAARITGELSKQIQNVVGVREIYDHPTIRELAKVIDQIQIATPSEATLPPLEKAPADEPTLASFEQRRLWFMANLFSSTSAYTVGWLKEFENIDFKALEAAFAKVQIKHSALRTTLHESSGDVVQIVGEEPLSHMENLDLSNEPKPEEAAKRKAQELWNRQFDLEKGPLFRGTLLTLDKQRSILILAAHHSIVDGHSIEIINADLEAFYLSNGRDTDQLPSEIEYSDYAHWQRRAVETPTFEQAIATLVEKFATAPEVITLPTDRPRPERQDFRGGRTTFELDSGLIKAINRSAKEMQTTDFSIVLSAYVVALARHSSQDEIVVGVPVANRTDPKIRNLVGFLVNTIPLPIRVNQSETFAALVQTVHEHLITAQEYQWIPLERLVNELQPTRSLKYNPVFQVLANEVKYSSVQDDVSPLVKSILGTTTQAQFDISMLYTHDEEKGSISFDYSTSLFDERSVKKFGERMLHFLIHALQQPTQLITAIPLMEVLERQALVVSRNETTKALSSGSETIVDYIKKASRENAEKVAIRSLNGEISYRELDEMSDALAGYLQEEFGLDGGFRVGLTVKRSTVQVLFLLAILKSGNAYVPIDPDAPANRINYIIEKANVKLLLTDQRSKIHADPKSFSLLDINEAFEAACSAMLQPTGASADPFAEAYVIFTSGSTGNPKGVSVSHRALLNRLLWMQSTFNASTSDRVLQKTVSHFDVSVWEFFWPLMFGARLVLTGPDGHKEPKHIAQVLEEESITIAHFVPSMLSAFLSMTSGERFSAQRLLIFSGEALPIADAITAAERFPNASLYNLYGPTEATVDVSFWKFDAAETELIAPIGTPVANTQLYVLDQGLQPVPDGVIGELYIGGVQVANGYVADPRRTATSFVPNPYHCGRMYATGDLARFREDGTLEYVGRSDTQVKIRGFRIELGEIEARLRDVDGVGEAAVLAPQFPQGDSRLIAFFTLAENSELSSKDLQFELAKTLPEYMIPPYFVSLPELPTTSNGKLDRKKLLTEEILASLAVDSNAEYRAPEDETQKVLQQIWNELLGIDQISIDRDFFAIGGHSLLVAEMAVKVRERLDYELDLSTVFENRTIETLAEALRTDVDTDQSGEDPSELFDLI